MGGTKISSKKPNNFIANLHDSTCLGVSSQSWWDGQQSHVPCEELKVCNLGKNTYLVAAEKKQYLE